MCFRPWLKKKKATAASVFTPLLKDARICYIDPSHNGLTHQERDPSTESPGTTPPQGPNTFGPLAS